MNPITQVTGTGMPLVLDDIDTDRIIPARFLRCVTFDGLGEHAFEDDRQQDAGHPFNEAKFQQASVLVAGRNFGCGSSREHAPQALMRWGIKAILGESFAEIFFGNCTSLGVPALTMSRGDLEEIAAKINNNPALQIVVDVEKSQVYVGDDTYQASLPDSAKSALVSGEYDFLAQLVDNADNIRNTASQLPYVNQFAS